MAKLAIVVRFAFPGIHSWPDAPQGLDERYLALPHRHMFHVEAVLPVVHEERQVEIIAFKNELQAFCVARFSGPHTMSCETMARRLMDTFDLSRCTVLEDNENGAEVTA